MVKDRFKSLVISCDYKGTIKEVLLNKLHYPEKKLAGKNFISLLDQQSRAKGLSFLDKACSQKGIFNYELNIKLGKEIEPFSFSGISYKGDIIIIISNTNTVLNELFEQIALINNEQSNMLRSRYKEAAGMPEFRNQDISSDELEQVSRLNNELVNMQRKMAAKNRQLEMLIQELNERSRRDQLTSLYNRRYFYEKIDEETDRAKRLGYRIILASIDINNFKSINDQYGHKAGDELLINFAGIMQNRLRKNLDSVFRFGGDEFVVLLIKCSAKKAGEILERINRELVSLNPEVSISYGIAEVPLDEESDIEELLKFSDERMYEHKKSSKDTGKR